MNRKFSLLFLTFAALALIGMTPAVAQSLISGEIAGVVTDPSGAAVPKATVKLTGRDTGSAQSTITNSNGEYRFGLLKPGRYSIAAESTGFQTSQRSVELSVGQTVTSNFQLELGQSTQHVDVTADQALINTEPSNNTTFTSAQMDALPSAGGDITNIAFTTPGAVVNTMGGYGNFTVNGLPATSNLFTINGENNMDPYFNIANSGATNLTLGQNELQEATVITNAYGGQYGQLSGAQVTYVTRSGTNEFHGNTLYWWNGRTMNSNSFFNNEFGSDRPFSNANQWAARVGGPIIKNRTWFFVNTEGLRFILPVSTLMTIPTPAFSNAVLANVQALHPVEAPLYKRMLDLWQNTPGSGAARPLANTSFCNSVKVPGFNPTTQACAQQFTSNSSALASEWRLAFRLDHKLTEKNNMFFRYLMDRGTQPTTIDPVSPNFNAISKQPSWDTQFGDTHIINATATNEFTATFSHYVAQFAQDQQLALSTFPTQIVTSGAVPFTGFNPVGSFPQGRNVSQYQIIDNVSWTVGSHGIRFGGNFRRYDVSDHTFFFTNPGTYFGYTPDGLQKFADGVAYQYRQSLNQLNDVPIALAGLGLYIHDDWRVTKNFKLTLALRTEHNGNPVCNFNCFSNFTGPFNTLASTTNANPGSVPYSADIKTNLGNAFAGTDAVNWSPRIGFSYSPFKNGKTVISGGFGIFYDPVPAGLASNFLANPPLTTAIRVRPATGTLPFDPNGGPATYAASAAAFSMDKSFNQLKAQLAALGSVFTPPAFTAAVGTLHSQQFREWNFSIQHQLSNSWLIAANYAGNSGRNIPYVNNWANAYDPYGIYPTVSSIREAGTPPVPNYGTVGYLQSGAISNYHGLSVTVTKRMAGWASMHASYTWSHNLDEMSNGGIFTYGDSLLTMNNPASLRIGNYGNSDYDIRHNFSADMVFTPKAHFDNKVVSSVVNGWQISGKVFWRSGLPFSVVDGNWNGAITNGGGTIFAYPTGGNAYSHACDHSAVNTPCLNANAFLDSASDSFSGFPGLSPQSRNQFRGPHFFDTDVNLFRNFAIKERMHLGFGIQAFNVFNHPNFANPDNNLGSPTFGTFQGTVGSPTSPYGTFLGFDSSVRTVQLTGKFTF